MRRENLHLDLHLPGQQLLDELVEGYLLTAVDRLLHVRTLQVLKH